jgi:hypothetical protein
MLVNTFFENKVEQLFEVAGRLAKALSQAGIEYRVIGGFAAYMHVNEIEPMAARLTRDIDVAIDRKDLEAIAEAEQVAADSKVNASQLYGCAAIHSLVAADAPNVSE